MPTFKECSEKGCSRPVRARDLCHMHYQRVLRHGKPITLRPETWGTLEKHPLYHTWGWMKRKSGKKDSPPVCAEWLQDFRVFVKDVGERPSKRHRLRLLDPHREYCKDNVFWEQPKTKVWGKDKKEYAKNYQKQYRKTNPENIRNTHLKKNYGITLNDYIKMHRDQNGLCLICNQPETVILKGKLIDLAVDHCHTTGKVRGLLCHHCNKALGAFKDSVDILKSAITYLEQHKQ